MAKPEISKSQAIRDFVTKYPDFAVDDVVSVLAKEGTKVSKDLVYVVKSQMKAKKHKEQREKAEAKAATAASSDAPTSKSAAIHAILKGNRQMKTKDVLSALAEKGISVSEKMVYYVKGKMKGQRGRKKQQMVAQVAAITVATTPASANVDAVKTILRVKGWANEVGGLKKLKALVDALNE